MEKYLNSEITSDEKLDVARQSTDAILQYIGTQKSFQEKQDKGLEYLSVSANSMRKGLQYLKLMVAFGLLIFLFYIGSLVYQAINPPSTEIDRKWISQQQKNIASQQDYISIQQKQINADKIKNTSDALINLRAQEALAVDRSDIAAARLQIQQIQKNSIRRDSLFNQKKTLNVKTVNANKVDVVNTKSVILKK